LELTFHDLLSPEWVQSEVHDVVLLPNQSTELLKIRVPGPSREGVSAGDPLSVESANVVASARLVDAASGEILARYSDWPEPYRFLQPPVPGLKISSVEDKCQTRLTLSVERPAKCVVLSVDDPPTKLRWSDNALDLIPGDKQEVVVSGLEGRKIKVAYFGHEQAYDI
jgi:beta-mannosidase